MFRFEFQKLWIIYLVTSSTLFTLPPPVFSQHQSIYLRSFASQNQTSNAEPKGGSEGGEHDAEGGAEPVQSGSSPMAEGAELTGPEGDNVVPSESLRRYLGRPPPRPSKGRSSGPPRPPRRHPSPRPHRKPTSEPDSGPREKPVLIKKSKLKKPLLSVPKLSKSLFDRFRKQPRPQALPLQDRRSHEQHDRSFERPPPSPRVPISYPGPTPPSTRESLETSAGNSIEVKVPHTTKDSHNRGRHHRHPPTVLKEVSPSIQLQLYHGGSDSSSFSDEKPRDYRSGPGGPPHDYKGGPDGPRGHDYKGGPDGPHGHDYKGGPDGPDDYRGGPLFHKDGPHDHKDDPHPQTSHSGEFQPPYVNGQRPPYGYIMTDDKYELDELKANSHLRRRKECDGLENFIYDMEIISFLLGFVAALFGLYSDVIPFFNDGVKISYNNPLLGHGSDFPHDYWPKHDTKIDLRTISIGATPEQMKESLSVTGEFIGGLGLFISFFALFPSLVEKFFYSLDWWFGKRGLWKQYLYTYKCEVHTYPQPGWGKVG